MVERNTTTILEIVTARGEAYGAEVEAAVKEINEANRTAGGKVWDLWDVRPGLRQLERDGMLVSRAGGPRGRIYYRLTDAGRALLGRLRATRVPA